MFDVNKIFNTNITACEDLVPPAEFKQRLPITDASAKTILESRQVIEAILDGKDKRIFVVVGPCSIHDSKAALEYAERLKKLHDEVKDKIYLVMRVYFEKPRTTVGWKGLINDPYMDDSFHIEDGLTLARELLLKFTGMGLPTATEALDPITPQYLSELISWAAIGARTTESQTHRELASGLSMPVGFKNGTDGGIAVAVNALKSSLSPHHFIGIDQDGRIAKFATRGNNYAHVVLRGGSKPNYDATSIATCTAELKKNGLRTQVVVDCSHGNSSKDHNRQPIVFEDGIKQICEGNRDIVGFMLESFLGAGNQDIPKDLTQLKYGVSVTDKCIDWATTETCIRDAFKKLG
jgi:3-deoxy-7-phosphoheptulonate synthase